MSIRWAWSFVWGAKPPKTPVVTGLLQCLLGIGFWKLWNILQVAQRWSIAIHHFHWSKSFSLASVRTLFILTPWLMFLWQYEEIGTTNLSWCLASADNKSITEPTWESYVCSHSSTRPTATFAIVFTGHCSYFVYIFPPAQKLFSLYYIYTQKRSRAINVTLAAMIPATFLYWGKAKIQTHNWIFLYIFCYIMCAH